MRLFCTKYTGMQIISPMHCGRHSSSSRSYMTTYISPGTLLYVTPCVTLELKSVESQNNHPIYHPGMLHIPPAVSVMPHSPCDTPKISAPPKCRPRTATTFLTACLWSISTVLPRCLPFVANFNLARRQDQHYPIPSPTPNPDPLGGSNSAGAVARLRSVLGKWQSFVTTLITPLFITRP